MTLLACIRTKDALLIGADSLMVNSETAVGTKTEKLYRIGSSVVWGFSGDESVGYEFKRWADDKERAIMSWEAVKKEAEQKLSELNGLNRRLAALSRTDAQVAEVLIAGYLGSPRILTIHNSGAATFREPEEGAFLGSGSAYAEVAWKALLRAGHKANVDTFTTVLETVAASVVGCGPPIQLFEITASGTRSLT